LQKAISVLHSRNDTLELRLELITVSPELNGKGDCKLGEF